MAGSPMNITHLELTLPPRSMKKQTKRGFANTVCLLRRPHPPHPSKLAHPGTWGYPHRRSVTPYSNHAHSFEWIGAIQISALIRHVEFEDNDGGKLRLLNGKDNIGIIDPSVKNGHHRPFAKRVKEDETFTVLTEFEVCPPRHYKDTIA